MPLLCYWGVASTDVKLPFIAVGQPRVILWQRLLQPWTWVPEGITGTEHSVFHCHKKGIVTADASVLVSDLQVLEYLSRQRMHFTLYCFILCGVISSLLSFFSIPCHPLRVDVCRQLSPAARNKTPSI